MNSDNYRIRADFRRRVISLLHDLDADMPDFLLASRMVSVFDTAVALFGKEMYECMGNRAIMNARQRHGVCQHCDNDLAPIVTHPPVCEYCDARIEAEAEEMEDYGGTTEV